MKVAIIFLLVILCAGCVTYRMPYLSASQQASIQQPSPFSTVILGVNRLSDSNALDSQRLLDGFISDFAQTGFFKDVNYIDQLKQSPDLVIDVYPLRKRLRCMTGEGSLMVITLGIIPLDLGSVKGYSFKISNPAKEKTLDFQFKYKQKGYMGSLISLLNISPKWSFSRPDEIKHEISLLKHELILRQEEIKRTLNSGNY